MQKVTITIETGNDAFTECPGVEIARILMETAEQFAARGTVLRKLYDINGNAVGECVITD